MAGETDHTVHVTDEPVVDENKSASRVKSDVPAVSSSSNVAIVKMANKTTPSMFDYWKKSMITEADHSAYHSAGWQCGGLESRVHEVDVPMVGGSIVVCFESHLVAGLGLPPSKFLVAIMNFLGCELVHMNPNAIVVFSCFTMLCECWLRFAPNTIRFWYFYSSAHYDKTVYSEIGLSLHRSRRKDYIDVTFKSS
jgi:hypothetical protein